MNQNGTSGKLKFLGYGGLNSGEDGVVQRGLGSCFMPKVIVNLCPALICAQSDPKFVP